MEMPSKLALSGQNGRPSQVISPAVINVSLSIEDLKKIKEEEMGNKVFPMSIKHAWLRRRIPALMDGAIVRTQIKRDCGLMQCI